jgi:hypothetical protein
MDNIDIINELYKNRPKHVLDQIVQRKLVIGSTYEQHYDIEGFLHNDDEPAVIYPSGNKLYYWHGWLHRLDGPAKIDITYGEMYYLYGYYIDSKEEFAKTSRILKLKKLGF